MESKRKHQPALEIKDDISTGYLAPCGSVDVRYIAQIKRNNPVINIIDVSAKQPCIIGNIKVDNIIAIGSQQNADGESIITVARDGIKIWDKEQFSTADDKESAHAFTFHFDAVNLFDGVQSDIAIHSFPNENRYIVRSPYTIRTAYLVDKEAFIPSLPYGLSTCSALVEPHYLALCVDNEEIHLFDVRNKDFLQKKPCMIFNVPGVNLLYVWPGGELWAIGHLDRDTYYYHYTFCKFDAAKKQLLQIAALSEPVIGLPVLAGNLFYYTPADKNSTAREIKTFDPRTGLASHFMYAPGKEGIQQLISTVQGLFVQYHYGKNPQIVSYPIPTREELRAEVHAHSPLHHGPAGIVAEYAYGFYQKIPAPRRQPQPVKQPEMIAKLDAYIADAAMEKYRDGLQALKKIILEQPELSYAECIAKTPAMNELWKRSQGWFARLSKTENVLVTLLKEIQEMNKPLGEYKRLR